MDDEGSSESIQAMPSLVRAADHASGWVGACKAPEKGEQGPQQVAAVHGPANVLPRRSHLWLGSRGRLPGHQVCVPTQPTDSCVQVQMFNLPANIFSVSIVKPQQKQQKSKREIVR